jgi:hypothetical protein
MSDADQRPIGLRSPRMWIYIVMLVGGMIWGVHLIVHVIHAARG